MGPGCSLNIKVVGVLVGNFHNKPKNTSKFFVNHILPLKDINISPLWKSNVWLSFWYTEKNKITEMKSKKMPGCIAKSNEFKHLESRLLKFLVFWLSFENL